MASRSMRRRLPIIVFLVGLLILGGALLLQLSGIADQKPAPSAIGGPFTLTDFNGRQVTEKDFLGKPLLIFFGFTQCPDICPTSLYEISEVLRAAGDKADEVQVAFVTIDPERDSLAMLKDYLGSFDGRILGLSGTREQIDAISKAYKIYAKKIPTGEGPDDYTMDHTAIVYFMDREGRFIGAFNMQRPPEEAARDLLNHL